MRDPVSFACEIVGSLYVDHSTQAMSSFASRHTIRQLEYILPGALVTYFYGTISEFLRILSHENLTHGSWLARCVCALIFLG